MSIPAVATDIGIRRLGLFRIPLDKIEGDPAQPRKNFDDQALMELALSIEKTGGPVQTPVARPHPEMTGHYLVVAGERRTRAMKLLGWPDAEYVVIEAEGEMDTFEISVVENCLRKDLNPVEEAGSFRDLLDRGRNITYIAGLSGKSELTVRNRLALLKLPAEVQRMIIEGKLPSTGALRLKQYKGPDSEVIELARRLCDGELPLELLDGELRAGELRKRKKAVPSSEANAGFRKGVIELLWKRFFLEAIARFLALPAKDQAQTWFSLEEKFRGRILDRLLEFHTSIGRLIEAIGRLSPPSLPDPGPKIPDPPLPPPPPAPAPPPQPPPTPDPPPNLDPPRFSGNQYRDFETILRHLLYATGGAQVNLSKPRLARIMGKGFSQEEVWDAFLLLRDSWQAPLPSEAGPARMFAVFVAQARRDYEHRSFLDFVEFACRADLGLARGDEQVIDLESLASA